MSETVAPAQRKTGKMLRHIFRRIR